MNQLQKRNQKKSVCVAFLLLMAYALRLYNAFWVEDAFTGTLLTWLRAFIYTGLILAWGISVYNRVLRCEIRRLFVSIVGLMLFWMLVRSIKFTLRHPAVCIRYLWYLYYIPMLFIPLLAFLIAVWLGRPADYKLPKRTGYLFFAAAFLFLLVITNDLHRLVFSFPVGFYEAYDNEYTYGILFYPVFGWRIAGLLGTVGMIFARSRVPQVKRRILLPMIPAVFLLLYGIAYVAGFPWSVGRFLEDLTVMESLLIISILECCLETGLIQSNTRYGELFQKLDLPCALVDEDYRVVTASDSFLGIDPETMRRAGERDVELPDGWILKSMPIRGGHILWTENILTLLALKQEAEDTAKLLSEEKDMLQAEIEMKQKQAVLATRNALYDSVVKEISHSFAEIDALVSAEYEDDEKRRTAMRRMCVVGAYIKRRCNLLIINEEHPLVSSEELALCLRESADYLRFYGADCTLNTGHKGMISTYSAKMAYDCFEKVAESVLDSLTAMLIFLDVQKEGVIFNIQAECDAHVLDLSAEEETVRRLGGSLSCEREDGVWYTKFFLPAEAGAE